MRLAVTIAVGLLTLAMSPAVAQEAGPVADEAFCAQVADRYVAAVETLPGTPVAGRDVEAEVTAWMTACAQAIADANAGPAASGEPAAASVEPAPSVGPSATPVPGSVSVIGDTIVLTGEGSFMERRRHRLVGDYQVVVGAERQDEPFCVLLVSFDYGKKLNRTHGGDELTVRNHGVGTSLHRNLDGRYVLDVVATEECGPWTVTVTPAGS
jgi:hypothetical protein